MKEEKCPKKLTILLGLGKTKKFNYIRGKEGATVYSAEEIKTEFDITNPETLSLKDIDAEEQVLNNLFNQDKSFSYMTPGYEILRTCDVIDKAQEKGYVVEILFFPMTKEELFQEEISEQMPKYWIDELVECMPTSLDILSENFDGIKILTL